MLDVFEKVIDLHDSGELRLDRDRFPATANDFGGDRFGFRLRAAIVHDHSSALGRETQRDGAADAAARAGN